MESGDVGVSGSKAMCTVLQYVSVLEEDSETNPAHKSMTFLLLSSVDN